MIGPFDTGSPLDQSEPLPQEMKRQQTRRAYRAGDMPSENPHRPVDPRLHSGVGTPQVDLLGASPFTQSLRSRLSRRHG
ncbi:MAG TPA: hypothetical protein VEH84_02015 [Alphaproteobacteria bacterium]|nr:hypothetical protein [Alphaproteobacteria bacterium]